jgi:hypothetical protein
MSIAERIKQGLAVLAVVSAIAVATHFGLAEIAKHPLLEILGPGGSG